MDLGGRGGWEGGKKDRICKGELGNMMPRWKYSLLVWFYLLRAAKGEGHSAFVGQWTQDVENLISVSCTI